MDGAKDPHELPVEIPKICKGSVIIQGLSKDAPETSQGCLKEGLGAWEKHFYFL